MARVFIGVGSNVAAERSIEQGLRLLAEQVPIIGISTFYRTEAAGPPGQPAFVNGVVEIETSLSPAQLKQGLLRAIESALGRRRTEDKYAARTLDLDLLLYDDLVSTEEGLSVPDPAIAHRAFLAIPLAELAPGLVVPGLDQPMEVLAASLGATGMHPLAEWSAGLRRGLLDASGEGRGSDSRAPD
jgi:2-amino-4-hydroxy-6-hydroxymethyldihydropteridine diphosphokinase